MSTPITPPRIADTIESPSPEPQPAAMAQTPTMAQAPAAPAIPATPPHPAAPPTAPPRRGPAPDRPASGHPAPTRPVSRFTPTAAPRLHGVPVPADQDPLARAARALSRRDLNPKQLGMAGEHYAALWLECQRWRILSRNWRSRYGELDIVALAPSGEIVFVEVKTRRSVAQGVPQAAVDQRKQTNLRHAAMEWLLDGSNDVSHFGTRFDVIAILATGAGPQVTHIPGAF